MRVARVRSAAGSTLAVIVGDRVVSAGDTDLAVSSAEEGLARYGSLEAWPAVEVSGQAVHVDDCRFDSPLAAPGKILGIGLNYRQHAADLAAHVPDRPVFFFKGSHTVIGPSDTIELPDMSNRVTAEAELGLVIGRYAYRVPVESALDHVGGCCCVLDQTAEDILREDPRLLTMSKNFAGFFSYGPELVPLSELRRIAGTLEDVVVETCKNGDSVRSNVVGDMHFSPAELVSGLSQIMPLYPGDVISTGTPGAVVVDDGDSVECRITGLRPLSNAVRSLDPGSMPNRDQPAAYTP